MFSAQEPVPGSWYVNRTGKLMKVRLLLYQGRRRQALLIEYLEGHRQIIGIDDWYCLQLNRRDMALETAVPRGSAAGLPKPEPSGEETR